jgi:hypothetical protein
MIVITCNREREGERERPKEIRGCFLPFNPTNKQAHKQTNKQTNKQTSKQANEDTNKNERLRTSFGTCPLGHCCLNSETNSSTCHAVG